MAVGQFDGQERLDRHQPLRIRHLHPGSCDKDNYLRATASYTDRYRVEKNSAKATASQISEQYQTQAAVTRHHPSQDTTATRSVRENTPAGAHLGAAFQASDTVDGDEIRYFLGGTDDDEPSTLSLRP